jgi:hypothetical protein
LLSNPVGASVALLGVCAASENAVRYAALAATNANTIVFGRFISISISPSLRKRRSISGGTRLFELDRRRRSTSNTRAFHTKTSSRIVVRPECPLDDQR